MVYFDFFLFKMKIQYIILDKYIFYKFLLVKIIACFNLSLLFLF